MIFFKTTFFLIALLTLSGCGDLFKKDVVEKPLDSSQFRTECKLDIDAFANIMEKDISSDIQCLGENLHLFIRVVETDKPGYLKRQNLKEYLINNRSDIKPDVINALDAVFDLNFLVFGESKDSISKTNVDKLVNFAMIFNEQASISFGLFQSKLPATFTRHNEDKKSIESAARTISMALKNIFNSSRNGQVHHIDIEKILESFLASDNRDVLEKARKLLFVKTVLVGGENSKLTHIELERIVLNFTQLIPIVFDAVRYKHITLNQDSILQLLKSDLDWLTKIIFQESLGNRSGNVFFTVDQAIEAVKILTEDDEDAFDVEKYRNLIIEAKKMAMGGNDTEIKGEDFRRLVDKTSELLKKGTIFHKIYKHFQTQLEMDNADPSAIDFTRYRRQYPEHDKELTEFIRIVTKYRFFRGEFLSAYYNHDFRTNANGVFEIALLEFVVDMAFKHQTPKLDANGNIVYGPDGKPVMVQWASPSNGLGGKSMSLDEVIAAMKRFEKELIDLEIILPKRVANTAETVSLLGSLFQYQSDENKVLDVNEATEFATTLLTSFDIAKDVFSFMKLEDRDGNSIQDNGRGACPVDSHGRVEPLCFKANFFRGVCKYYRPYYPKMFEYMGLSKDAKCEDFNPDTQHNRAFLKSAIEAARTCNYYPDGAKEEIFYTEGDTGTIFIALMHIETTILRWDVNKNNQMDPAEVDNAYRIYESALDGFVSGVVKNFKKQIYQYLVKYETVPDQKQFGSIWKFLKFLVRFNKKAPASRKTIAAILKTIGDQSKLKSIERGEPQFDCATLRNPDVLYGTKKMDYSGLKSGYTRLTLDDLALKAEISAQSDAEIEAELRQSHPELFR